MFPCYIIPVLLAELKGRILALFTLIWLLLTVLLYYSVYCVRN